MIAIYEIPPFFSHPVSIGVFVLLNSHPSCIHSRLKFLGIELMNSPGAYLQWRTGRNDILHSSKEI